MSNFWKTLPKPFLALAPLDDVTDVVFREIVAETARPDVFFTEFTAADGLFSPGREKIIHKLKYTENQRFIVAQIWGTDPDNLYEAAQLVQEMGFDGVDINMGCPAKDIMQKGCGSAMIMDFEKTKEVIDAVRRGANNIPVSVKTRCGKREWVTEEWISFLLRQNLDALTVHGRLAAEMSKYPARWDEIGKAVKLRDEISPDTIILGNGDVTGFEDAMEKHNTYGIDGAMIGRGIFANPFAFEKTKEKTKPTSKLLISLSLKHMDLYDSVWQGSKPFHPMKKFFKMYVKGFPGATELRDKLMHCNNSDEARSLLNSI
jgi:nifR3 family TIM-barrel protein